MVTQFLFTRKIGTQCFSVMIPCDGWDDAKDIAEKTGMTVDGDNVHTIPCVPIPQFMQFLSSLTFDERIQWKPHADEQIEAFLTCGWPEEPHEVD